MTYTAQDALLGQNKDLRFALEADINIINVQTQSPWFVNGNELTVEMAMVYPKMAMVYP